MPSLESSPRDCQQLPLLCLLPLPQTCGWQLLGRLLSLAPRSVVRTIGLWDALPLQRQLQLSTTGPVPLLTLLPTPPSLEALARQALVVAREVAG